MSEAYYGDSEMTKSSLPPLVAERKLQRVLTISRVDSIGVLVVASASLAVSLLSESWIFAAFSTLALGAGAMERHGNLQLQSGLREGLQWLTGAQGCLYTITIGYVFWRWQYFDGAAYWAEIPGPAREQITAQMVEAGLNPETDRPLLLKSMNFLICATLFVVSTLYQGGLAFWYSRQRNAIAQALEGNPSTDTFDAG